MAKEGRAIRNAEVLAERPDGTRVPFIPYPTPLRDGAGKIIGAINMLADVSERKQAETQQRILLNELNHRVKNNMQMLQILLEGGSRRVKSAEAREVLEKAGGRIIAMAAVQRVFYTTHDATRFNARDFLNTVCATAKQTFPPELDIDCEADAVQLQNDAAMPLALIANELLTNAVKYGLSGEVANTIRVRLRRESDSFEFYIEDDGPGFDLHSVQKRSSGLALVQGLALQLRGKLEVTQNAHDPMQCAVPAMQRLNSSISASVPRCGGCNVFARTDLVSGCRAAEVLRSWRSTPNRFLRSTASGPETRLSEHQYDSLRRSAPIVRRPGRTSIS